MDVYDLLALRGTRKILGILSEKGSMRYSELVRIVGFSTTTTRALKRMESFRLVERRVQDEPYRPVSYTLTEKGQRLSKIVKELEKIDG